MNSPESIARISSRTGSALIATMVFAFILFTLLGSALGLALGSYKMSQRNAMITGSLYLAEAGADEALWAVNTFATPQDWFDAGWEETPDGVYFQRSISTADEALQLDFNGTALIRVLVANPATNTNSIAVHSEGMIIPFDSSQPPTSQIIFLRATVQSPFIGLIAKDTLSFSGQPRFDSYDSNVFPNFYSFGVNSAQNVTVGSISQASGSVGLSNARIFGNVVSGANDPLGSGAVNAGPNAVVTGSYIGDFDQDFPDISAPDTTGWPTSF